MANFIGIHMLNEIIDTGYDDQINQQMDEGQYMDPATGAHFDYNDLVCRIKQLQKRRQIIDQAIRDENLAE